MLDFHGIDKRFGEQVVLRRLSLTIPAAQVTFLVGQSGAGKSVLARMAVGLEHPDAGRVVLGDEDLTRLDAAGWRRARRRCQLVLQQSALLDGLSALENVVLPLRRCLGLAHSAAVRRATELLELLHAAHAATQLPENMSAALRKQVAMARALALEPQVLLYDEPTSGLDPVTARRIDGVIRDLAERTHLTTLVVSHDLRSLAAVADRVAFLHEGAVHFVGTPAELFASRDAAVQAFVGAARPHTTLY